MPSTDTDTSPLAPHELAAWRGVLEVHARVTQQLDAQMQSEHGLSLSAYEVLMFLADAPEHRLRMSEIADRVLLSRSGCTRLVDRLVDQGYVTRCTASAHCSRADQIQDISVALVQTSPDVAEDDLVGGG